MSIIGMERIRPVFVSAKLTRRSGMTMRFLRWSRLAYYIFGTRTREDVLHLRGVVFRPQEQ
jgi:hypothetical protein